MPTNEGYEKAKQTAESLKTEETKQVNEEKAVVERVNMLPVSAEVAEFYKENADLGSEELSAKKKSVLKVVESSSQVELANGDRPRLGSFYYRREDENGVVEKVMEEVQAHFLAVSKGFYLPSLDTGQPKFNQIIAGVLADDLEPFTLFLSGKKLNPFWEWSADKLSKYTKVKNPITMFALRIKMTTEKTKNSITKKDGTTFENFSHIINFEVMTHKEDGNPILLDDIETLQLLKRATLSAKDMIDRYIDSKSISKNGEKSEPEQPVQEAEVEEIDLDEVPF